jgi:hypothetical protein
MAAVQAWQSITREDTQHLVMSIHRRLQAVTVQCFLIPENGGGETMYKIFYNF